MQSGIVLGEAKTVTRRWPVTGVAAAESKRVGVLAVDFDTANAFAICELSSRCRGSDVVVGELNHHPSLPTDVFVLLQVFRLVGVAIGEDIFVLNLDWKRSQQGITSMA